MEKLALHSSFLLAEFSKYYTHYSEVQRKRNKRIRVQETHGDQRDNTQTDTQGNDQMLFVECFILVLVVVVVVIVVVVVGGWRRWCR